MIKKIFVTLMLAISYPIIALATPISSDTFISPDDVSIAHLESFRTVTINTLNSFPGDNIQAGTISHDKLDANADVEKFRDEAFNDWVYSGLTIPTGAGLAATTTSGQAYVKGRRVQKDATTHTSYTAQTWTWVDLSNTGTYTYVEQAIGTGEPGISTNSIRIARVSADTADIVAVRDDRILAISLDANQSDYWRIGLEMSITSPDTISVLPGIVYNGTVKVLKTSTTTLNIGTAGDWASGGSERATSTYGFIAVSPGALIKLTTTAPTVADTAGNTTGKKRYSSISSTYWRILGWFYMDGTGSGNIREYAGSNFKDGPVCNVSMVTGDDDVATSSTSFVNMDDLTSNFYSSGGPVEMIFSGDMRSDVATSEQWLQMKYDNFTHTMSRNPAEANAQEPTEFTVVTYDTTQGGHTINFRWRCTGGTIYQDGLTYGPRRLIVKEL